MAVAFHPVVAQAWRHARQYGGAEIGGWFYRAGAGDGGCWPPAEGAAVAVRRSIDPLVAVEQAGGHEQHFCKYLKFNALILTSRPLNSPSFADSYSAIHIGRSAGSFAKKENRQFPL